MIQWIEAEIVGRIEEATDAVSLMIRPAVDFAFRPGDHVGIRTWIDGLPLVRTYTVSDAPRPGEPFRITFRRVPDGRMTEDLWRNGVSGRRISVSRPFAGMDFSHLPGSNVVFVAGGSGITPFQSCLEGIAGNTPAMLKLVYVTRSLQECIFLPKLQQLARAHAWFKPELFVTRVAATQAPLDGLPVHWRRPHLDDLAERMIGADRTYCVGPTGLIASARQAQARAGLSPERMQTETFVPRVPDEGDSGDIRIEVNGAPALTTRKDRSLLEALADSGIHLGSGCGAGLCQTCKVQVVRGQVRHMETSTLSSAERAKGYCLACTAVPVSDVAIRTIN